MVYAHKANGEILGYPRTLYTGIETLAKEAQVHLSPNPSTSSFHLTLSNPPLSESYFKLYDALGRMVKQEMMNAAYTTIQRDGLPDGIYFWQVETNESLFGKGKIVFQ